MPARLVRPVIGGPYEGRDETTVYGASGSVVGDVTLPATISLLSFNVGRRDIMCQVFFYSGQAIDTTAPLGWQIDINDNTVLKIQGNVSPDAYQAGGWMQFWPAEGKITILSLNSANNNTQERGCYFVGAKIDPATDAGGRDRARGESLEWFPKQPPPTTGINPFIKAVYGVTRI
tara:strand:- start:986 stop:1510 length:525 start_codon:yes stop_codon:yes gene_type:complete